MHEVNLNLLNSRIDASGVAKAFIARTLGIRTETLYRKLKGDNQFNCKEAMMLSEILHFTDNEAINIFLPYRVSGTQQTGIEV